MILWIILTVMAAISAAVLTIPLVRRHEARADARTATIAVLRDQLGDVDVQLAAGTIPPGDAEGLRTEIKRRMLAAGHIAEDGGRPVGSKALARLAIGLAAVTGLAAAAIYAGMGQPGLPGTGAVAGAVGAGAVADPGEAQVAGLVAGLEAKMAQNPGDPDGWRMLGWAYFQTGRFAESAQAYGKAIALKADGTGYQSAYGEALVQAANGQVTPAAVAAFSAAKAQDGADARARYFLGVAKQQGGDARGALDEWISLLGESATDAPWVPQLRGVIEQTAAAAKIDVAARLAALRPPVSGGATVAAPPMGVAGTPGPTAAQVEAVTAMPAADQGAMIQGMVDGLAKRLAANPRDEAGWLRLMRARVVLGDAAAAGKARDDAVAAFAGDVAAQGRIRAAAAGLGITG
ncbi:c-type cytochrome biogenesis protein CcmI [Polymorphobacter glacialis]|uniref:C-type cytochrome biogenesis protein CcmI n=1 Tax=Sandarakinorhabdus glacialis TaxID=1614636 RepID=A0A917EAJ7_9SPHN|nr:c-type cytochrome biogenesis protein CcmI [Polymorphobacter glacialis]GGE19241.1 c-type cytochrome biogenesis protein CcmI [Polymorphobacter glacialis]